MLGQPLLEIIGTSDVPLIGNGFGLEKVDVHAVPTDNRPGWGNGIALLRPAGYEGHPTSLGGGEPPPSEVGWRRRYPLRGFSKPGRVCCETLSTSRLLRPTNHQTSTCFPESWCTDDRPTVIE